MDPCVSALRATYERTGEVDVGRVEIVGCDAASGKYTFQFSMVTGM